MGSSVLDTARTEIPTKAERTMYRLAYHRLEFLERVLWVCLPVGAALAVPVTLQFGLTLSAYLLVGAGLGLLIGGVAHLVVSLSMWINRQQFETLYRYAQLSKIPFRSPAMSRTPGAQVKKQTVLLLLGAAALFITGFHALQSGLEGL